MNPTERQGLLYVHAEIAMADFVAASNVVEFSVPPGAKQEGVPTVTVTEVFDGTTPTLEFGTSTDPDGFDAAVDLTSLGTVVGDGALAATAAYIPAGDKIIATYIAGAGATDTGKVRVTVGYIVDNRATETQD